MYINLTNFISYILSLPLRILLKFERTKQHALRVIKKLSTTGGHEHFKRQSDNPLWRNKFLRFIDLYINLPTVTSYILNGRMQQPLYKAFGGSICDYCHWWIPQGETHQYCQDQLNQKLDEWPDDSSLLKNILAWWIELELCSYCEHPYQDHLNGGIQEPCRHSGCTCPTFVSEEYMAWQQYCKSLDEIETKRQGEKEAAWTLHQLAQDRAYRKAVEASWSEDKPDDAEWPDYKEEEEEPTHTQVWYTESPGGHNYYE